MEGLAKLLVSTLGGAAAGYDAPSAGAAIGSGISTGMALNEVFEAPERRRKQEERQDKLFQMQQERHNMSKENHAVRMENIDYTKQQRGVNDFSRGAKALMGASQNGRSRYLQNFLGQTKEYNALAQQNGNYPVSQKRIERIDNISKSSAALSNIDIVMYAGEQYNNTDNPAVKKEADFMLKSLQAETGIKFSENSTGDKVIEVNGQFLPFSPESMQYVKESLHKKIQEDYNYQINLDQTRHDARSGATKGVLTETSDSALPFDQKRAIAEAYKEKIGSDPRLAKAQGLTHTMHRINKEKEDPELLEIELQKLVGLFKEGDISFKQDADDMLVHEKDLNDYLNRGLPPHMRIDYFQGDSFRKIDNGLISTIRDKSGISGIRQQYIDNINQGGELHLKQREQEMQKLIADSDFKADLKTKQEIRSSERKNDVVMNKLRKGSFGKYKFEEIANTLPELSDGTFPVVAQIESMYENYVNEKSSITKLEREWSKAGYSGTYKEAIKDPSSTIFDLAKEHRKEFSKISPKIEEKVKLGLLRDFLTRRDVYDKKLKALSAKPTTQKKDLRSITEKNKSTVLDITKKAREN